MDILANEIETFYGTLLACKKYVMGTFNKRTEPLNITNSDLVLSNELKYLYSNYDVNVTLISKNIHLVGIDKLSEKQKGFKYISNDSGKTFEINKKWNKNWVVFADMNDDPIVADISEKRTPVYAGIEARNYIKIAPSLDIFFKILIEFLKTYEKNESDLDEDSDEYIEYENDTIIPYFKEQIAKTLDLKCLNNFIEFITL
jgi:hypothetical protein